MQRTNRRIISDLNVQMRRHVEKVPKLVISRASRVAEQVGSLPVEVFHRPEHSWWLIDSGMRKKKSQFEMNECRTRIWARGADGGGGGQAFQQRSGNDDVSHPISLKWTFRWANQTS